ncbi:MAG: MFS transporter, partial [Fimbriimonas ginsengisoli]|nr:MFS transporter [Fimbriimonas ginsengisoli]
MFPKQVLSISAFRALWLGQAISQLGDSFYYVVNAFMIKKLTGSAAMVGFNGVLECLPFLLIGPFAGVLADRLDRRRIMIASDLACFLTLLGLGLVVFLRPVPPVEAILATSALMFIARSFFLPSKNAAIPSIVPQDLLLKANAASAFTQNFVPMIGLALSAGVLGILYSISTTWFFLSAILVNSLSFLGSALFVRQLPALRAERTDRPKSAMKEL